MSLRTTKAKAVRQIERRDAEGAARYRAELRYFHYKPRLVIRMPESHTVADEMSSLAQALTKMVKRAGAAKHAGFVLAP